MKRALAIFFVNVGWPVLGWLWLAAAGEFIFRLPEGLLPQWFFGLSTIPLAGGALWLNATIYLGLTSSEFPFVSFARRSAALCGAVVSRAVKLTHVGGLSKRLPVAARNRSPS